MLVQVVVPLYPPSSRVGAWLATHEYLRHLVLRGHSVQVTRYMARRDPGYELDGVQVTDHRPLDGITEGADLLISHMGDNGAAHSDAVHRGVPSVRMIHGPTEDAARKLQGAALAVCNSQSTFSSVDWSGRMVVCRPITHPELHRTTPGHRVTLVNTSRPKGGELMPPLCAAMPDTEFLTVRGGYGTQLARPAPNLLQLDRMADMREVWSQTRILLIPSEAESWGMVGVEAMHSGIPVIAHPTPGLRESLGDAGIFADRGDLGAWISEIRRLQEPDQWEEASMKAKARAASLNFDDDLERFATSVESLAKVPA